MEKEFKVFEFIKQSRAAIKEEYGSYENFIQHLIDTGDETEAEMRRLGYNISKECD